MVKVITSFTIKRQLAAMLLVLGLLNAPLAGAELLQSLYNVFGSAGKAACEVAADGLALTPLRACSSTDTLTSPADLFCRFTRSDCNAAYALGEQAVNETQDCIADPLGCTREAFTEACELAGNACGLAHDAMSALRDCVSTNEPCADELMRTFGTGGHQACRQAAELVPTLPPTRDQCDVVYARSIEVSDCLANSDKASCLVGLFEDRCVAAARFYPHTAQDCAALSNLADQGISTVEQCLDNLLECPQELMQQLNEGVVRLRGKIVDEQQQPLIGVMVSAVPVTDDVLVAATSTHVALTDSEGQWHIDINPAFSFRGEYRVNATGTLHDFFAINNMPRFDYVVTVE